jgi:hypothetical protein
LKSLINSLAENLRRSFGHQRDFCNRAAASAFFRILLKRPVTIVALSNTTRRTATELAQGAKPDKVVLASGELNAFSGPLDGVADILDDPALLPPTLVIHHGKDSCRVTNPASVAPFQAWAGDRVHKVAWFDGGTEGSGGFASLGRHGFGGQDDR